jgi:hypothetical protein
LSCGENPASSTKATKEADNMCIDFERWQMEKGLLSISKKKEKVGTIFKG